MTADTIRVGYKAVEILNTCNMLSSITTILSTVNALQIAEIRRSESFSKSKIRLFAKFIICVTLHLLFSGSHLQRSLFHYFSCLFFQTKDILSPEKIIFRCHLQLTFRILRRKHAIPFDHRFLLQK